MGCAVPVLLMFAIWGGPWTFPESLLAPVTSSDQLSESFLALALSDQPPGSVLGDPSLCPSLLMSVFLPNQLHLFKGNVGTWLCDLGEDILLYFFCKDKNVGGVCILDSHCTVPAKPTNLAYIILFALSYPSINISFFFLPFHFQMVMIQKCNPMLYGRFFNTVLC